MLLTSSLSQLGPSFRKKETKSKWGEIELTCLNCTRIEAGLKDIDINIHLFIHNRFRNKTCKRRVYLVNRNHTCAQITHTNKRPNSSPHNLIKMCTSIHHISRHKLIHHRSIQPSSIYQFHSASYNHPSISQSVRPSVHPTVNHDEDVCACSI